MQVILPAPPRSPSRSDAELRVEALDTAGAAAHRQAWADLARRAVAPDIFIDPLFALPAARRFPPALQPTFLLVWASCGDGQSSLVGLCAVRPARFGPGVPVTRAWMHEQAVAAAPLLDADRAVEALAAMLAWLARSGRGRAGLLCQGVPLDGPLGRVLTGPTVPHAVVGVRSRAVLTREGGGARGRHAKEWRRQSRRLFDRGTVAFRSARGIEAARGVLERFLVLEAAGWKGRRGTALGQNPALAAFVRALVGGLAGEGRCRIDSLELDGRPIAMGILLRSRDHAYYWKTAFDEAFAALSPGRQFTLALTSGQVLDPDVILTDSCALPDHPMIDRLWPERIEVADVLVGAPETPQHLIDRAAWVLRAGGLCRNVLKGGRRTAVAWSRRLKAVLRHVTASKPRG